MFTPRNVMVTGGAGFIGSNFIHYLLADEAFTGTVVNVDALTYAGNLENLAETNRRHGGKRYFFEKVDICDYPAVEEIFSKYEIDTVVHFAAESHVDRSIHGPGAFVGTNINGTFTLLEGAVKSWRDRRDVLFHYVSTDEVYGSLGETGYFYETTPYSPRSPYSASKASAAHLVRAYHYTYGLPVTLSNCSNNYGPYQFPEKLIPLITANAMSCKPLPIYGDGKNVRDWLYVEDHCRAIVSVIRGGRRCQEYNVGGNSEKTNLEVVDAICRLLDEVYPVAKNPAAADAEKPVASYRDLITFVKDRPGHDRRYAVNCAKIEAELGWRPTVDFDEGLRRTVSWYIEHTEWVEHIRSGRYQEWIDKNYGDR